MDVALIQAKRFHTFLRKAILQHPILIRLDFPLPFVFPQTRQNTQKLLSPSLHAPSCPNNPWQNVRINGAALSSPQQQKPSKIFFSGSRISFRLSKQNEYTVRPKSTLSKKHQPTSVPPEHLLELDRKFVAEHLKVGVGCWMSSCSKDCRELYSVGSAHTLWKSCGSSWAHLDTSYEIQSRSLFSKVLKLSSVGAPSCWDIPACGCWEMDLNWLQWKAESGICCFTGMVPTYKGFTYGAWRLNTTSQWSPP